MTKRLTCFANPSHSIRPPRQKPTIISVTCGRTTACTWMKPKKLARAHECAHDRISNTLAAQNDVGSLERSVCCFPFRDPGRSDLARRQRHQFPSANFDPGRHRDDSRLPTRSACGENVSRNSQSHKGGRSSFCHRVRRAGRVARLDRADDFSSKRELCKGSSRLYRASPRSHCRSDLSLRPNIRVIWRGARKVCIDESHKLARRPSLAFSFRTTSADCPKRCCAFAERFTPHAFGRD